MNKTILLLFLLAQTGEAMARREYLDDGQGRVGEIITEGNQVQVYKIGSSRTSQTSGLVGYWDPSTNRGSDKNGRTVYSLSELTNRCFQ